MAVVMEATNNGWWRGPVEVRARKWAEAVYARTRGDRPWPTFGGPVLAHARRAIADVLSLDAVGDAMVRAAYEVARARYEELTARRDAR